MCLITFSIETHINENDEKALKHLTRVDYKYSEDAKTPYNFTVTMNFTANEFFENEVLSVTFHMQEPRDVTKTEGTEIKWKEGVNFTKKNVTKKQKNKKTGQTRTVTQEETVPSFFNLFKSIEAPAEDKDKEVNYISNIMMSNSKKVGRRRDGITKSNP